MLKLPKERVLQPTLKSIGLSDGEVVVYLALLKLGPSPVSKIKRESAIHRTTVYDFLEKLIIRGLVSYVLKNNVKHYKVTGPEKLLDFVREKEENLREALPELLALSKEHQEDVVVEVHAGLEGIKTPFNNILSIGSAETLIRKGIFPLCYVFA